MNYTKNNYKQINFKERVKIEYLLNDCKYSLRKVASILRRAVSSVSREIKRNTIDNKYSASWAHSKYMARFSSKHQNPNEKYREFSDLFKLYFDKRWHGVDITWHRIRVEKPSIRIPSLKQIYNWINSGKWIIKRKDRLRRGYVKGGKRNNGYFSKFNTKYVFPIWTRWEEINSRREFGHWEIDLVVGKQSWGHSNLLTLTERKTRVNFIMKIPSKDPKILNGYLYKLMNKYNLLIKSITSDNGLEFKALGLFGYQTGIDIYKCNPYASHERGSNEHSNGLIRRMYPKKTDFNKVSNTKLEILMDQINSMPRKIFGYKSSYEMYASEISQVNVKEEKEKLKNKALEKRVRKTSRRIGFTYLKNFEI